MSDKIIPIAQGVEGLFIRNERFNTTSISYNFYLPMKEETAALNALLPFVLTSCGKEYPDFSALTLKLYKLYGAQLDASVEKYGDCQLLTMRISVINDRFTFDSDSLVKAASDMLLGLIFEPNTENGAFMDCDLEREKRKAIEHIKGEIAEKRIYAKNRLISEIFKGEAFGIPKCGTVEQVEAITGETLYAAWKNMLSSAFVRVQVIGESLPPKFFESVTERFGEIERFDITNCRLCKPTAPAKKVKTVFEKMEVKQGKLVMGFSSEIYGDDDITLPLLVMCDIFGGAPYSRLFTNVREKMSLCYYCASSANRFKGLITVDSGVEWQNADKAADEIINQLEIMQKGEFTDFEFESSIKSISDTLMGYYDSQSGIDTWYALKVHNNKLYSPEDILEKLKAITREDVVYAAKGVKLHTIYKLLPKEGPIC